MRPSRDKTVLAVIDFQETLFEKCRHRKEVEKKAVKLIRAARLLDLAIIVTEQYPKGLGPTSRKIAEALGPFEPLSKTRFSCMGDEAFLTRLEEGKWDHVICCGIEAHICIFQTARDLVASGRRVLVAADGITSRGKIDVEVALARMREEGAIVSSTEMIIYDLLGGSGTEEFKKLLPLLKE